MKANELMIGDWVKPFGSYEGVYMKITSIGEDKVQGITIAGNPHHDFYEKINPIPITPEILEKNEFTHSFGDSDFYDYEKWEKKVDDKTIRVIKDHDGWFCRVDDNKLTRSMGIAPAVHTMQNIIRIGGVEKTIEL